MPLLQGNPFVDEIIPFDRRGPASLFSSWRQLRGLTPDLAIDFQGLLQSSIAGRIARPRAFFGFDRSVARESLATFFYTQHVAVTGPHRIQRNLQLVAAAGAATLTEEAWIPPGNPQGDLPSRPFVLASPFAGWTSKQWPIESYERLGRILHKEGLELVLNVPNEQLIDLQGLSSVQLHTSSLDGLIDATRCAVAIVGVDSGPLHLAAALDKPGVALFGPTDPAQTGPFNSRMVVLRASGVQTTYKRHNRVHASMTELSPEQVSGALLKSLAGQPRAGDRFVSPACLPSSKAHLS